MTHPDGAVRPGDALTLRVGEPERIDRLLARELPLSRTRVRSLLEGGAVRVDGEVARRASLVPAPGSLIQVELPPAPSSSLVPDALPLEILFEDDALVVVNKPAGLVVHPAPGHPRGTLVNALVARGDLPSAEGQRPGIVHRLDKDTSGVIVVAKTTAAHGALAAQFKAREVRKLYDAVAWGHLPGESGTIERAIARSRADRQRMTVDARRGRPALTRWRRLARYAVAEHLEVELATGRTHQVRVHLSSLGHPLVGDARYGGGPVRVAGFQGPQRAIAKGALEIMRRMALHARRLELAHPTTGAPLAFEAPLPADIHRLLEFLT